jgi:phosphoribosylpyrophosphate synthetase
VIIAGGVPWSLEMYHLMQLSAGSIYHAAVVGLFPEKQLKNISFDNIEELAVTEFEEIKR